MVCLPCIFIHVDVITLIQFRLIMAPESAFDSWVDDYNICFSPQSARVVYLNIIKLLPVNIKGDPEKLCEILAPQT